MFKHWFKKEETVVAPVQGDIVALADVDDPTFAENMMGEGCALWPEEGRVVSPVQGEIVQLFPTQHAIGLRSEKGLEILIHIGLETVQMDGDGFEALVRKGQRVKQGETLIEWSVKRVREKAKSTITPVVLTNSTQFQRVEILAESGRAVLGETPLMNVRV